MTSLDPGFIISNLARDLQTASVHMSGEQGREFAGSAVRDVPKAIKAMYRVLRDPDATGELEDVVREYQEAGGPTGYFHSKDFYALAEDLEKRLRTIDPDGPGDKARAAFSKALEIIETGNKAVEHGVRVSAYRQARLSGMSKQKAAALARDLTTDFQRKGEWGSVMNALYLFYSASVSGSYRMLKAVSTSPTVRKIAVGIVAAGAATDMLNRILGGEDDDEIPYWDKIPDYVKSRNWVVMIPGSGGDYLKLPLPYGYSLFHTTGSSLSALASGAKGAGEAFQAIASETLSSFNPVGTGPLLQVASPTVFDPVVQVATNQTFYGAPIRPENLSLPGVVPRPESQLYWSNVSGPSRAISSFLNRISGGDKIEPGLIDISPEHIDHWVSFFSGGPGKLLLRSVKSGEALAAGRSVALNDVPILRRVWAEKSPYFDSRLYRDNASDLRKLRKRISTLREEGDEQAARELEARNRGVLSLYPRLREIDSLLRKIDDPEDERVGLLYRRFNRAYQSAQ